jgi:hypothetical protein
VKVFLSANPSRGVQESVSPAARPDAGDLEAVSPAKAPPPGDLRGDFRALYDAWFEDVSRWIVALGGIDADRDDIVQEVFLVVRRRLSTSTVKPGRLAVPHHPPAGARFPPAQLVRHIFTKRRLEELTTCRTAAAPQRRR